MIFFKCEWRFLVSMMSFLVCMGIGFAENTQELPLGEEISNEQQLNQFIQDIAPLIKELQCQVNLGKKINYEHLIKHVVAMSSAAVAGPCVMAFFGEFLTQLMSDFLDQKPWWNNSSPEIRNVFTVIGFLGILVGPGALIYLILYQLLLKNSPASEKEALLLIEKIEALKEQLNSLKHESAQVVLGVSGSHDGLSYDSK